MAEPVCSGFGPLEWRIRESRCLELFASFFGGRVGEIRPMALELDEAVFVLFNDFSQIVEELVKVRGFASRTLKDFLKL
jgi:hypothetical protein